MRARIALYSKVRRHASSAVSGGRAGDAKSGEVIHHEETTVRGRRAVDRPRDTSRRRGLGAAVPPGRGPKEHRKGSSCLPPGGSSYIATLRSLFAYSAARRTPRVLPRPTVQAQQEISLVEPPSARPPSRR